MKINDLYVQQDQLDEVSLGGIGRGIAKGVGAVSRGVGAVAGGVAGAVDAAAQGFAGGRAAVSGQAPATTATNTTSKTQATGAPAGNASAATAPAGNVAAPAGGAPAGGATAKGTADFGTIQRSIKTLSPNQKTALASQLAGKTPATTAPAAPATPPPAATAPTGPQKGQEVALASGEKYRFAGQQWVEIDPTTGAEVGGAALPAGFQKSLTGIAAKQQASSTTDAGTPNLRVVDGGKAAVAEGFYYRSKFLNIIL
jgi:hypothetical protein